ncbi:MAG: anaerobic ribonucleoside-triphosphate reductase activating protein [Prevotellaceae bacterium]|nr:anaerobic ribonucleoside-triphosphate reductase activating protein [Prevotellaceae bacterium]
MKILEAYRETIADGYGLRYSVYLSGCEHSCRGCHNPQSQDPQNGSLLTEERLRQMADDVNSNPLLDGITLSGGDPFFFPKSLFVLLKELKDRTNQNIWCYTGYTYEFLLANPDYSACLPYIDVLVDGPFVKEKLSPHLHFVGSSNQRILKLKNGAVVE